ncbi:putative reverse transcriptase domain-containing protein [Tanacetum coccineum]
MYYLFLKLRRYGTRHTSFIHEEEGCSMRLCIDYWELNHITIGLTNAMAIFMDLMNRVFHEYLDRFVIVFINDILVYSKMREEYEDHLRIVLEIFRQKKLYSKFSKCDFCLGQVAFLGHILYADDISMDTAKVEAITRWLRPMTVTERKGEKFVWNEELEKSFEELKRRLVSSPVLTLPSGTCGYQIYSVASKKGLGCVLMQHGKVNAYASSQLNCMRIHDVAKFVAKCLTSQQGLPRTFKKNDAFWVVVDRLTNLAHFLPILQGYSVSKLAKIFQLKFSTAFHPQTDGQTECTIQTLEDMLRSCALEWTGNWDEYLCLVEFAYKNSWHASIKRALFELLYGRKCRAPIFWNEVEERVIECSELVEVMNEKLPLLKRNSVTIKELCLSSSKSLRI